MYIISTSQIKSSISELVQAMHKGVDNLKTIAAHVMKLVPTLDFTTGDNTFPCKIF